MLRYTKSFRVFYVKPQKKIDIVYTFEFFFIQTSCFIKHHRRVIVIIITVGVLCVRCKQTWKQYLLARPRAVLNFP